eukprot:749445-Hanusia_phi.AAC.5
MERLRSQRRGGQRLVSRGSRDHRRILLFKSLRPLHEISELEIPEHIKEEAAASVRLDIPSEACQVPGPAGRTAEWD